ncbi:hypothetical protein EJF36_18915 [Bacillus sp. HMF5848]|uniref:dynamin family protein n=1 Tax=Bacillus sp. HMF5848 TaxID=2495421 RepID=UPI000F78C701|nr:dynamin family protein [Bacillus sp. HMF5848]RSK28779.1 hypothetical protein EJF36_18915 [Bacillus sp. HMF5848]
MDANMNKNIGTKTGMDRKTDTNTNWKQSFIEGIENWQNLIESHTKYADDSIDFRALKDDVQDELLVMIAGEFKAGKSTFINALLGSEEVTSDVTPATAVVTKLTYGDKRRIFAHFKNGETKEYEEQWLEQLTAEREGRFAFVRKQLSYIELQIPNELLKKFTIVDTPGLNSQHDHHTEATESFLQRADVAIWLFNYRNVGTTTEVEWLKKLKENNIEPIAIVNGIDMMDEEEDSLDEFLEYNYRRLYPLVNKMLGVSAREALQSKLENDPQLYEWSNWQEIDTLFKKLEKLSDKKVERVYRRLYHPLKNLYDNLLEEKATFLLSQRLPQMETFLFTDYPAFLEKQEQYHVANESFNNKLEYWQTSVKPKPSFLKEALANTEAMLGKVEQAAGSAYAQPAPIQYWQQTGEELVHDLQDKETTLARDIQTLYNEKEELQQQWIDLQARKYFKKKKLTTFAQMQSNYNHNAEGLYRRNTALTKKAKKVKNMFAKLSADLNTFINNDIDAIKTHANAQVEQYNTYLTGFKELWQEIPLSTSQAMAEYFQWLDSYIDTVIPPLQQHGEKITGLEAYQECAALFEAISLLYVQFPFTEWAKAVKTAKKQPHIKHLTYDEILVSLGPSKVLRNPLSTPDLLRYKVEQEIHDISDKRKKRLVTVLSLAAISTFIVAYANSRDDIYDEVASDYEEYPYEDGVVESSGYEEYDESYYDESYDESYSDESYNTYEDPDYTEAVDVYEYFGEYGIQDFLHEMYNEMLRYGRSMDFYYYFTDYSWIEHKDMISEDMLDSYSLLSIGYDENRQVVARTRETHRFEGDLREYNVQYVLDWVPDSRLAITDVTVEPLFEQSYVTNEEIVSFIERFRTSYMDALNYYGFEEVRPFLKYDSVAYHEIEDYIETVSGKGFKFNFEKIAVTAIEKVTDLEYLVSTTETFTFTDDQNQETFYEKEKQYRLNVVNTPDYSYLEIREIVILDTQKEETVQNVDEAPINTASQISVSDVVTFMEGFYKASVVAFNEYGFANVAAYYDPTGPEYANAEAYLTYAQEKNMQMNNIEFFVDTYSELDHNHILVSAYVEDEYYYQDGSGDRKKIEVSYVVEVTESGEMFIESVDNLTILEEVEF